MTEPPKLFISYSWTTPNHEDWVLRLAKDLVVQGIDVILDKWHLREGQDKYVFMEQMVTDPAMKKVALICDRAYAEKANERRGGVGDETQIITPEIYAKTDQQKFVAVLAELDENNRPYLPAYLQSRIHIDLSDDDKYARNFEQLLRWLYDQPLLVRPELGPPPDFLEGGLAVSLATGIVYRRALDAIRQGSSNARGAVATFFDTFARNMERLRLDDPRDPKLATRVREAITDFIPFRDQTIAVFEALAQYRQLPESYQLIHTFFEQLAQYLYFKPVAGAVHEYQLDHYRFVVHEMYLYCIAILLKHEFFDAVGHLFRTDYYVGKADGHSAGIEPFTEFYQGVRAIEYENQQASQRWLSPQGNLLKERANKSEVSFDELMQADFMCYLRSALDAIQGKKIRNWWPVTLVYAESYHNRTFPVFARAASKAYFQGLGKALDVSNRTDLAAFEDSLRSRRIQAPSWQFVTVPVFSLMNLEHLASRP